MDPREELAKLRKQASLVRSMFPRQEAVWRDRCRFKVVWTTRRAGKTLTALLDWCIDALDHPYSLSVYIGITHSSTKRIAWLALKRLNRIHGLGIRFQEAELAATMPNGAVLQLFGADRPGLADRLLGTRLRRAYVDEAGHHRNDLDYLIDGVLLDAVSDEQGQIWLLSNPGVITRGVFFELTRNLPWQESFSGRTPPATDEYPKAGRWSVHRWTTAENPYMAEVWARELEEARATNPECERDPDFIRNRLGAWVYTADELVYAWDPRVNTYPGEWEPSPGDHYILGMDYGWDDRQAMSLCVYRDDSPVLVELESVRLQHALMDELHERVQAYMAIYPGLTILGDPGSKQYFEEFRRRYALPVMPAEKSSKFEWIQIVNTALRRGEIKIVHPETSPHVEEMSSLTWHIKPDGRKVERPGLANDACDAFLYAFRHARHYLRGEEEPELVPMDRREAMIQEEERRIIKALEERYRDDRDYDLI